MDKGVLKIATIAGIDIKLHWSWLLILLLVTYEISAGYFPRLMPGENAVLYLALGIVASLLFFVSVLIHELCHSLTAKARGYKVKDIVLFIFGGVSSIQEEPRTARDEFLIAVVGPLSSVVLAGVFYALSKVVTPPVGKVGAGVASIMQYLAVINLLLGLFNMLPGFPLDGGRVLRSIIWGVNRDFDRSTRIAATVGQLVAYGFIFWGLYEIFFNDNFGGLWTSFIGWFLLNAAQQSAASTRVHDMVRGVRVAQVMEPSPPVAAPHFTLAHLLTQFMLAYKLRAVPVVQEGKLVGIVTMGDIQHVPQDEWGTVTVADVMTGADKLRVVQPQDTMEHAMQILSEGDFDQIPVIDAQEHLVGILVRGRVLRWMQMRDQLNRNTPGRQDAPTPTAP